MKEKDKTKEQLIEELEKLHQELHLYRMIVEKMPLALTVWRLEDLDNPGSFRLLACNPQIEEATGAPYREFVGTTVRETFPSSLEAEGPHIYAEAVRSGQVRQLPDLHFPGDEQTAAGVYSVTVVPLGGRVAAMFCENITERKRVEEEIKQRNRELAALNAITASIMESALDLDEVLQRTADGVVEGLGCNTAFIFLLDEEEGVFKSGAVSTKDKILQRMNAIIEFPLLQIKIPAKRDFNEAMSNLLDGRPTIKQDFYELVRPLWSKPVCYAMQRLLDSRTFFTMPLIAKGKTVGGIIASTREELGEGETEKLMTFANQAAIAIENARLYEEAQQEITERKRAQKELKESEVRYRALVESSYDHIFMLDRSGTYLASNDQVGQFGLESGESLVGCHLRDVYPPELAEFYQRQLEQVLTTGQAVYFEHHMPEPDGHRYHLDTLYPIRSDGEVWALGGICRDITERRQAQEELRQSFEKLRGALEGTVNVLASAIAMRDPYTANHQRRVTQLACAIAKEMGVSEAQIEGLRIASLIHDIGKIHVPAEILSKPGRLSDIEFGLIKMHPQVGHDILKTVEFPWPVAQMVLQHHERMDGSGYPQGLSGEEIILEARILAVADVVEAMASHRPYRPSRGIGLALEEISQNRGVLYDPEVVDACLRLFSEKRFKFE